MSVPFDEPTLTPIKTVRPGDWLDLAEIVDSHLDEHREHFDCKEGNRCEAHLAADFEFVIVSEITEYYVEPHDPVFRTFHFIQGGSVSLNASAAPINVWGYDPEETE